MANKERENFNRNSTLIVEHTKEGLTDLIYLNVLRTKHCASFEDFINSKQHEIYHLCYNRSRCCQCPPGCTLPIFPSRVLHPPQLEILLDKRGPKKMCHIPGRTADFCCCCSHIGLTTNVLDVTLARCLLANFCQEVFWESCLTAQKLTFEAFLKHNKHKIYHLFDINRRCCQCPISYTFPTQRAVLATAQWNHLFSTPCLPCPNDRKRPPGGPQTICASSVTSGITIANLSADLSKTLIEHCCPLRETIEKLVQLRNNVFGHVKQAKIAEKDYIKYRYEIESSLIVIARICNNEKDVKQKLIDLDKRTLDGTLLMQSIKEQLDMKDALTTTIRQETSAIKEEITMLTTQQTAEFKSEIATLKEEMKTVKEQESTHIKEYIGKTITDESFTNQIAQGIVKQQIEEKRKRFLENTQASIEAHCNENTFVHTNAVDEALKYVKQNGIVILTGTPGIGKSRVGLELLRQLSSSTERGQSIQLHDISQWQDMSDGIDVVFIDDVFGRTNSSYDDNVHSSFLDMIFTSVKNGKVKVILTLRNSIYRTIDDITDSHRIFHGHHILDLSSSTFLMTAEEKKSCLINYFTKNNIIETDDPEKENINDSAILDTSLEVYLHKDTLKKILCADVGTHIGFPEACYLFASHRKFTIQGHTFFCHPTEKLLKEIDKLRMEGHKYVEGKVNIERQIDFTLLVYILLNGDSFNVYVLDPDTFLAIMKTVYLNPPANIPTSYINDSTKRLLGKYLKMNSDYNYCFQHRLIAEAVMISYSVDDLSRVIPLLSFDFITEMARPLCYSKRVGEVVFTIPVSCYGILAQRLLQLLATKYDTQQFAFLQNLCKSKIITKTGEVLLQAMVERYKFNTFNRVDGSDFISDPRFSRENTYIDGGSVHFHLPSALMMYCKIAKRSDYKYLYDSIHKTLASESDNDVIEACTETLVTAFTFALCTLDRKRSTLILNILRYHNIKRDYPSLAFCANIVLCQGLPAVKLMLDLPDLCQVFNNSSFFHGIFCQFCVHTYNIDDSMEQFITSVILNHEPDRSTVNAIMTFVCKQGQLNFVKDIHERVHNTVLDVDDMISCACESGNSEVIVWLIEKFRGLYDIQKVLDNARHDRFIEGVKIVFDKVDHSLLDKESLMNNACRSGNTDLIKWLCEIFGNIFDMNTLMNYACRCGKTELVKWLCERFGNKLFDMKLAVGHACSKPSNIELIKWLCEKIDKNMLDIKTVMNYTCRNGDTELLKWLYENFGKTLLNMKLVLNDACESGHTELVQWICENFDNDLFDRQSAVDKACSSGNTELVKMLCVRFENHFADKRTAMNNACLSGNTELVKWLCETFDSEQFDLKSAMNDACSSGKSELVHWLFEEFEIDMFDMKGAINNACNSFNTGLVKWLFEEFHDNWFDLKSAMNNACRSGNYNVVKWLCGRFDNELFDMKSAISHAFHHYDNRELDIPSYYFLKDLIINNKVIQWLFDNFDTDLFDVDSTDYTISRYYHYDLIQFVYNLL